MKPPELDWRLDDIPSEGEANMPPPAPTGPRRRWRWSWRRAGVALGLLAVAALAVYAYQQLGWQRLREQVAREVAFEDERSAAGDLMAVLAMQAVDNPRWRNRRSEEAALGLAAPLPAPHLAPVDTPPQLLHLDTAGGDVFTATVRRLYADSAGQTYAFDLTQRYRNAGAGLWQRLPPLAPTPTIGWFGRYLSAASLPLGEEALWAADLLPQVDRQVAQACAAWACPPDLRLRLEFEGQADAEDPYGLPAWAAAESGGSSVAVAPYPATFDLVAAVPFMPPGGPVTLPGLSLIGVPADAPARQALTHAVTLRLLYAIAARLSVASGPGGDPYLVALLARAEARLGLSAASTALPPTASLLSPQWLWENRDLPASASGENRPASLSSLEGRQHALAFLNHALRGQLSSADGPLLNSLFRRRDLTVWLAQAMGQEAADAALPAWTAVLPAWTAVLNAEYARQSGQPAPDPTGLHYICGGTLYRAGADGPQQLESGFRPILTSLAVDGDYVAYLSFGPDGEPSLRVLGPAITVARVVTTIRGNLSLLGWSADGHLLYLQGPGERPSLMLMRYDPATDRHERLLEQVMPPGLALGPSWTADRTTVGLTVARNGTGSAPVAVRVVDPVRVEPLANSGRGAWLSPDGQYAAYVTGGPGATDAGAATPTLQVVVRSAPGAAPGVVVAEAAYPIPSAEPGTLGLIHWAADSQALVFAAITNEGGFSAYRLALAGGPPELLAPPIPGEFGPIPLGFSADGRYLALAYTGLDDVMRLSAMAWPAGPTRDYAPLGGLIGLAWSATGHRLALPTGGGLYLTDPATGAAQWVTMEGCEGAGWGR